jgi:hypothetical protein
VASGDSLGPWYGSASYNCLYKPSASASRVRPSGMFSLHLNSSLHLVLLLPVPVCPSSL